MARIAVIGAGMGALAAAARLAVAGHDITVCERTETYGGALRHYTRDGFGFDTGPGLLRLPAVYRDLFLKTGREALERHVELAQVDPTARHIFADGTAVSLPGTSRGRLLDALDAAFGPGSGERWAEMLGRARTAWDATRRPLLEEPLRVDEPSGSGPAARDPYPALRRRGLLRRRPPTLSEAAHDELRDPRLAALLESYPRAHGVDPGTAPASAAVLAYLEDAFGCWYVQGGMRRLADALYQRCLERRVRFRFDAEVARPLETDGRVSGVELTDGETVPAEFVVAGGWPGQWPQPTAGAPPRPERPQDQRHRAASRFSVLLALRGARPEGTPHRTVVHRADAPDQPLTVLRPDDPALRPDERHESAVLTVCLPPDGQPGAGADEAADGLAERLLAAADAAGLGLGERLLWRECRTSAEAEAVTGAPDGLVPAPALAGAEGGYLHRANQTALPGLYLVGGWSHPGGGLAHAGMSGALVAGLIVEGDSFRGSQ